MTARVLQFRDSGKHYRQLLEHLLRSSPLFPDVHSSQHGVAASRYSRCSSCLEFWASVLLEQQDRHLLVPILHGVVQRRDAPAAQDVGIGTLTE